MMHLKYLTWIFAGLFVLFGIMIPVTENPSWLRLWAGLSTLSLGGFGLSMAGDALATRQIRLQFSVILHAQQPRLFWAAVVLVTAAGSGTSIAGVWFLFFKNWA